MAKIKKFQIIRVPVEVEYFKPIFGRLFGVYVWLKSIRLKKIKLTIFVEKKILTLQWVYRLYIPQYLGTKE